MSDQRNDTQRRMDETDDAETQKPADVPWGEADDRPAGGEEDIPGGTQDQPHQGEEGQDIV